MSVNNPPKPKKIPYKLETEVEVVWEMTERAEPVSIDEFDLSLRLMGNWHPDTETWNSLIVNDDRKSDISRPYPFCLAYALDKSSDDLGHTSEWIAEWKWDGIRVQLVSMKSEVKLYSRSGDDISNSFPDIIENSFSQDFCLDGELMAGSIKIPGSFNDLQQRLNRKNPSKDLIRNMPTFIVAYDALYIKGQDIRDKSVIDRRELLKAFILEEKLVDFESFIIIKLFFVKIVCCLYCNPLNLFKISKKVLFLILNI